MVVGRFCYSQWYDYFYPNEGKIQVDLYDYNLGNLIDTQEYSFLNGSSVCDGGNDTGIPQIKEFSGLNPNHNYKVRVQVKGK